MITMLIGAAVISSGCATSSQKNLPPPSLSKSMEVTAYCPCKKCCAWKRNWLGRPVFASGAMKGERKKVGQTASGEMARPGTIAADTSMYPFGTIMYVPGYGYGTVQDRGGAIKGEKIDLYFKKHKQALQWGRVQKEVYIWLPGDAHSIKHASAEP